MSGGWDGGQTLENRLRAEAHARVNGSGVLDGVDGRTYDGVWKLWKAGSITIFAVFVLVLVDCARTLRRIARRWEP